MKIQQIMSMQSASKNCNGSKNMNNQVSLPKSVALKDTFEPSFGSCDVPEAAYITVCATTGAHGTMPF